MLENPKTQYLDKTFLAKSEVSWLRKPNIVAKGAQESFRFFAENITKQLEADNLAITELFFKEAVARVILFRKVEKLISSSDWYDGGFRAQTVTYSIAYLSQVIKQRKQFLNFELIWELQDIPNELVLILNKITKAVYAEITDPPQGTANISQWCKREACWENVKQLDLSLIIDTKLLVGKEEIKYIAKSDKTEKIMESGIEMQSFVVSTPLDTWKQLHQYFSKSGPGSAVSGTQVDILHKMSTGLMALPSEKQSKVLYGLFQKAEREGFVLQTK